MEDTDRAYLAGLFDGEGCANATFRSKSYKGRRYQWPSVQFVIAGQHQHMSQISVMFGAEGKHIYEQSSRHVWEFRATRPEDVLHYTDIILPYVKLKSTELKLLKQAAQFLIEHESHSKWSQKDKESFYKSFVQPLQKSTPAGRRKGRKRMYAFL